MTEHISGSANIVAGPATIAPAGPPHTYLGMARLFLQGVRPLATTVPPCTVALAFLSTQVAECALKASLSRTGDDKRLKSHDLRHNLAALWRLATTEGLSVSADPPAWLERLSHLHDSPYHLRYSTGVHGLVLPGPEPMCTELESLVSHVQHQVTG
jgi:hypothetical protein